MGKLQIMISALALIVSIASGQSNGNNNVGNFIRHDLKNDAFPIVHNKAATIIIDPDEHEGVKDIVGLFQQDVRSVTDLKPEISTFIDKKDEYIIIVGTLGKNKLLDELVKNGKLDVSDVEFKWETSLIQTIDNPFKKVKKALVIAGSDKRGTMYGVFEISRKMGVSPWYWWADVTPDKHDIISLETGRYLVDEPKVKYRGIFLNDEEPALGRWAVENYGGFTHEFYLKVFELLLRLKGNYLWPAMWWASFNSNDTLNPALADKYGIVMGTTHHEPMMRAHAEWKKNGNGEWNYITNAGELQKFWKDGITRMGNNESIVTIGMRGDGDKAMSQETNIQLLENIVDNQRNIITEITGKPIKDVPQLWALYKEVQDYYDEGMRVPDDVTLLLCDDNWGNIRKLPELSAKHRTGGYGIYYHFDYVGGPRNYKWLNTNPLPRIWEQMNLAYEHGVNEIWLVNVGDLKPMELPISFFLDLAWNPEDFTLNRLENYTTNWAIEQFGNTFSNEIGEILELYPKYNSRRKPELLKENTYNLVNYNEFENIVNGHNLIAKQTAEIYTKIKPEKKDAFYQLVYHPVIASANLNELYFTVAKNKLYAEQGRASTNTMAGLAEKHFAKDAGLTDYFHTKLAGGKWNHMMAQTHISYTYWQQPEKDVMPEVKKTEVPYASIMRLSVEGNKNWWPKYDSPLYLPRFDSFNDQTYFFELFNAGSMPFNYKIVTNENWIIVSKPKGNVNSDEKIYVNIHWEKLQTDTNKGQLMIISGNQDSVIVNIEANKAKTSSLPANTFIENNGMVSMEAAHYSRLVHNDEVSWINIPGMGRTLSSMTSSPSTVSYDDISENSPTLEYDFYLTDSVKNNTITMQVYLSPTLNFHNKDLYFAIAIDDEKPQLVNVHKNKSLQFWEEAVRRNCYTFSTNHHVSMKGKHTLKYFMLSGGLVLQKLVIDNGGLKDSYLGPPESKIVRTE